MFALVTHVPSSLAPGRFAWFRIELGKSSPDKCAPARFSRVRTALDRSAALRLRNGYSVPHLFTVPRFSNPEPPQNLTGIGT